MNEYNHLDTTRDHGPEFDAGELPDLFRPPGFDRRISTAAEWPAARKAWLDQVLETGYGGLPPAGDGVEIEHLCTSTLKTWPGSPTLVSMRVHCRGGAVPFSFRARLLYPSGKGMCPTIAYGDGCWWYLNDRIAGRLVGDGYALFIFDRTEFAEDPPVGTRREACRSGGLYDVYPDHPFGALAAWAWGYHRAVDVLQEFEQIDAARIAITGHSRGGKTVLLAGATDERIAVVNDNASGSQGSALQRYRGTGSETLADCVGRFEAWFGPRTGEFAGREAELPYDQHCLLAAIAPRPLLLTYALDDAWANPPGMVQAVDATRTAYRILGVPETSCSFHIRAGEHRHDPEDWDVLRDFLRWQWGGGEPGVEYNRHPYRLGRVFRWEPPGP